MLYWKWLITEWNNEACVALRDKSKANVTRNWTVDRRKWYDLSLVSQRRFYISTPAACALTLLKLLTTNQQLLACRPLVFRTSCLLASYNIITQPPWSLFIVCGLCASVSFVIFKLREILKFWNLIRLLTSPFFGDVHLDASLWQSIRNVRKKKCLAQKTQ